MKEIGKLIAIALFLVVNSAFMQDCGGSPESEEHEGPYMMLYVNGELLGDSILDIPSDGGVYRINSSHSSIFHISQAYANTDTIYDVEKQYGSMNMHEWYLNDTWYDIRYRQPLDEKDDTYPQNAKLYMIVTLQPNETDEVRTLSFYLHYDYQCGNWLTLRQDGKSINH